jgi:hypothetical protein|tara:strand:- start:4804 stop:5064 length:261 start_codon:yes stop_codon:yes gene_type:complete
MTTTSAIESVKGSTISIPTSLLFAVLAGGVGTVSGNLGGGISASEVSDMVDDKIAAREEVIGLKLESIVNAVERVEGKIDNFHKAP